jgi:hypothetical protein
MKCARLAEGMQYQKQRTDQMYSLERYEAVSSVNDICFTDIVL